MKLNKLSKEKRNHLILVALGALTVVAGLYICLIQHQNESLSQLSQKKQNAAKKLKLVLETVNRADQIKADVEVSRTALAEAERDVATGDLYAWVINWLRGFKASYKVEMPQFSQLSAPSDVNLLPKFPYKQTTLTVAGTAHYHDLGLFLADLENRFPHVRLLNLNIDSGPTSATAEPETLSFKVDIVTLAKTNPS
jgi:hypothetical protein